MSRRVGFSGKSPSLGVVRSVWDNHLMDDEEILWQGRPGFGVSFNKSAFMTLVTVAVGMYIFGPQLLAADRPGPMHDMLKIPVLNMQVPAVGILIFAGGWTVLWFLKQTITTPFFMRYMLSNQRAYIRKTLAWSKVKSYALDPYKVLEYDGGQNGTIIFASEIRRADNGKKRSFPVGFKNVHNAKEVYKMMVEIQKDQVQKRPR